MVGCAMARRTRSGTLVGPGIWRKCRPLMGHTISKHATKTRKHETECNHEGTKTRRLEDTKTNGSTRRRAAAHRQHKPADEQTGCTERLFVHRFALPEH